MKSASFSRSESGQKLRDMSARKSQNRTFESITSGETARNKRSQKGLKVDTEGSKFNSRGASTVTSAKHSDRLSHTLKKENRIGKKNSSF